MLRAIDTLSLTVFGCFYPAGLEWEDDFPAMEKSCHFRCARQTVSQPHTLTLPIQSCAALSRRFFLPQTCLFLTPFTESDLDPWGKGCVAHTQWAGCWFLWHRGGSLSFNVTCPQPKAVSLSPWPYVTSTLVFLSDSWPWPNGKTD